MPAPSLYFYTWDGRSWNKLARGITRLMKSGLTLLVSHIKSGDATHSDYPLIFPNFWIYHFIFELVVPFLSSFYYSRDVWMQSALYVSVMLVLMYKSFELVLILVLITIFLGNCTILFLLHSPCLSVKSTFDRHSWRYTQEVLGSFGDSQSGNNI